RRPQQSCFVRFERVLAEGNDQRRNGRHGDQHKSFGGRRLQLRIIDVAQAFLHIVRTQHTIPPGGSLSCRHEIAPRAWFDRSSSSSRRCASRNARMPTSPRGGPTSSWSALQTRSCAVTSRASKSCGTTSSERCI